MKAIIKATDADYHTCVVPNELHALQEIVGGWLEAVTIHTLKGEDLDSPAIILCDEEGRLKGREHSCTINGVDFCGTVLIVGAEEDRFTDVPEKAVEILVKEEK